jgi:hypothetical protein
VQDARGKHPVTRVKEGPNQRKSQSSSPAGPAPSERVGVPGEVGHWADGAERNQAPLDAPERKGTKVRLRRRWRNAPGNTVAVVRTILGALITQR